MRTPAAYRKLIGVAATLAVVGGPTVSTAAEGGSSLFGVVPQSMRGSTTEVVSERVGGKRVSAMPAPTDGRFLFANLAAGDYVVRLVGASGETVAQSQVARVQPEAATEAVFEVDRSVPAVAFGGGGPSKALLIVSGAAVAGVGTAIFVATGDETRPASPSR